METPIVGETAFDMSGGTRRYALDWRTQTLVLDFYADAVGNPATGKLAIYAGENTGSLPWAVVNAGSLLSRPISVSGSGTVITIVPIGACTGLLHICAVATVLSAGRS